ncbi:MAG: reverse transcriptase N-terminal domain-containing protein [Anaerotignum sp.]|nr:reverse transcriptase N-terminal domain-containing protein [Anaerotignum sp.]
MNFSSSTTDKTESLKDANSLAIQWETIDWSKVEIEVNRLQPQIAKATADAKRNKAKQLQYLLSHSFTAKAFAVRKVTTNKGKNTSGVNKKLWSTSSSKIKAVLMLTDRGYRTNPLKRVYIAKKGKNKKRPLGIQTMYDRAMCEYPKVCVNL